MEKKQDKEEILQKTTFSKESILHILISSFLSIIFIWDRIVNIPKFPKNFLCLEFLLPFFYLRLLNTTYI